MTSHQKFSDLKLDDRWGVVASTVQSRMHDLDLDQQTLARRAGLSPSVVGDLQRGTTKRYQLRTLLDVSAGLALHPMALVALLAGNDDASRLSPAPAGRGTTVMADAEVA